MSPIGPLQHIGMQLDLEGKTIGFGSLEVEIHLSCPPNSAAFRCAARAY